MLLLTVWPASLSVMASTLAAPFVLGVPAEIYAFGTEFSLLVIGYAIGVPLVTHFFFTRFYDMEISSIYEVNIMMFISYWVTW
jgi:Na+/proline symporter